MGMVLLLVAAIKRRNTRTCKGLEVEIKNNPQPIFVERRDIVGMFGLAIPGQKARRSVNSI